jgi:PIN domain nuclease of toxin-antitoxin system
MILLDTHIWYWWVHRPSLLTTTQQNMREANVAHGLGVSVISCWEVAKRVEYGKMELSRPIQEWMPLALRFSGVHLVPLTPEIAVMSTQLPGKFHKDPADQIIVATAMLLDCPLVTSDGKILEFPHVTTVY